MYKKVLLNNPGNSDIYRPRSMWLETELAHMGYKRGYLWYEGPETKRKLSFPRTLDRVNSWKSTILREFSRR